MNHKQKDNTHLYDYADGNLISNANNFTRLVLQLKA